MHKFPATARDAPVIAFNFSHINITALYNELTMDAALKDALTWYGVINLRGFHLSFVHSLM